MKTSLLLSLLLTAPAVAQEHGHDHTAGADQPGHVTLTAMMAQNLDLETAEVELRPIETTLPALGRVEPEPGKITAVTSRVAGRVTKLAVHDGQRVEAGQFLLEVESRVVADPPPRLTFTSPIAGVVLDTQVMLGAAVEPDRELVTVIDLSVVDVVGQVHEGQISRIHAGQTVRIRPVAHPDLVLTGKVKAKAASLDRATGTLRVFVHADNPDEQLLPGMRAQLAFVTAEHDAAVVVPRAAVLGEAGNAFVFRQTSPLSYVRTPVLPGLRDDRFIEIIEGVLPGDQVVTRGNYQLQFVGTGGAELIEDDHGHSHGPGGKH